MNHENLVFISFSFVVYRLVFGLGIRKNLSEMLLKMTREFRVRRS